MSLIPRSNLFDTDRFFNSFLSPFGGEPESTGQFFAPRVDIADKDDHYEITAELPGVEKENIHVTLHNGVLTLEAESKQENSEEKGGKVIRRERHYGKLMRSFTIGDGVQESDISADFKDGVLLLKAPKAKDVLPERRRISIR